MQWRGQNANLSSGQKAQTIKKFEEQYSQFNSTQTEHYEALKEQKALGSGPSIPGSSGQYSSDPSSRTGGLIDHILHRGDK